MWSRGPGSRMSEGTRAPIGPRIPEQNKRDAEGNPVVETNKQTLPAEILCRWNR